MNKLEFILPQNIILNIYNSRIMPQINYCILVLGHTNKRIFKLQKRNSANHIHMYKKRRLSHTDLIVKNLKIA